jgi:hypothetical protein
MELRAEVPALLRELWAAIGGEDSAWVTALEGSLWEA